MIGDWATRIKGNQEKYEYQLSLNIYIITFLLTPNDGEITKNSIYLSAS